MKKSKKSFTVLGRTSKRSDKAEDFTDLESFDRPRSRSSVQGVKKKKRRRGKLYFLLSLFVVIIAGVVAGSMFFQVKNIVVTGTTRYSAEQIIAASDVHRDDKLFFLRGGAISDRIEQKYPYVRYVKIKRQLPETLVLEVTEEQVGLAFEQADGFVLATLDGKMLEQIPARTEGTLVVGYALSNTAVGSNFKSEDADQQKVFSDLLSSMKKHDLTEKIDVIDVTQAFDVRLSYEGRISVTMGLHERYDTKLAMLKKVVEKLYDTERGRLDLSGEKASFIADMSAGGLSS